MLKVVQQHFLTVLFGDQPEWVHNYETVPQTGVYLPVEQSALEHEQHLGSIDGVHLDKVPLH